MLCLVLSQFTWPSPPLFGKGASEDAHFHLRTLFVLSAWASMHTIPSFHAAHDQMAPGIPPVEASELPDTFWEMVQDG